MKTIKIIIVILLAFFFASTTRVFAASPNPNLVKTDYFQGKVVSASSIGSGQALMIELTNGPEKGKQIKINYDPQGLPSLRLNPNDCIVITKQTDASNHPIYAVNDKSRLPNVGFALVLFAALVILIAGRKGVGSLVGLAISLGVIFIFIIPLILSGQNPLLVCLIGSFVILPATTFIAHGFSKQTSIALISTLTALILTLILASVVLQFTLLSGFGTEEAYDLHLGLKSLVDFRGLLLGGIIIATLGALNDVTTTQAATIFELHKSDPKIEFDELLVKGMSVGREHVVSLVNTLVLAFVGASLGLFLLYFFNPNKAPLWVVLNSEIISEEIIKTVVGTAGLLLSMPIVTVLSTFICVDIIGEKHK